MNLTPAIKGHRLRGIHIACIRPRVFTVIKVDRQRQARPPAKALLAIGSNIRGGYMTTQFESVFDEPVKAGTEKAATEAQNTALDMLRSCVEHLRTPGGRSIASVAYDENGDKLASRIMYAQGKEFWFKSDGNEYELKTAPLRDSGLYRVNGDQKTKVEKDSEEYKKALDQIQKVDFDHLPLC